MTTSTLLTAVISRILGIYELLRRRCKLIIVVDVEADFAMHFPSFVTLQRYARIDIDVRIEMPWKKI